MYKAMAFAAKQIGTNRATAGPNFGGKFPSPGRSFEQSSAQPFLAFHVSLSLFSFLSLTSFSPSTYIHIPATALAAVFLSLLVPTCHRLADKVAKLAFTHRHPLDRRGSLQPLLGQLSTLCTQHFGPQAPASKITSIPQHRPTFLRFKIPDRPPGPGKRNAVFGESNRKPVQSEERACS